MGYVKAVERREQIVEAAIRVLSSVGVPNTTLRAIAVEAGVPLGTLHYVFPSKDEMLRAVIAALIDEVLVAVKSGLELDRGLAHALRHGVFRFWDTLVEGGVGVQVMQYELAMYSVRSEGSGGLAQLQFERYTALVSEFCEQAANAANESCAVDFGTLGRLSLAVLDGVIVQYVTNPDSVRARRDLERAIEMVVKYADPQPVGDGRA
ncbi:TetR/AcrR family transcriptional regulator [Antrihabitans sp. YC3-6]|uniref:TetR/AcrR family transcriptional regulator n=1 Tax=Antrihabitans stalagmiti TaxID=2799499 RepID=A0A934U3C0_9NOCA|nr:TetR/AcrR family transcriptional regulator [Antrihabitans stalagmiti]MBJ8339422.1 TetR/AcrR family transcriptional regulator [Antrihabitans stalagmiti]